MSETVSLWIVAVMVALWLSATGCAPGQSGERTGEEAGTGDSATATPEESAGTGGISSGTDEGTAPECSAPTISDPAFDISDERLLVGFAENVFLGRVEEDLGGKALASASAGPFMPRTRFSVEVVDNVKDELDGTVTVEQQGGYLPDPGCVSLVNGDPLLEPGREYMLLTRGGGRDDPRQIVAPEYGKVPVEDAADREALVRRYEKAAENQRDPFSER